ncbi:MAG: sugar phosphate isomerase/epimerase [Bacteroidetes bacterium]|jgi:sugar phosphate isomerase/epimerase|nr:MAG: sugar phosphate isomerase/epimerase [Bacteroidota bacterium]
MTDSRRTFIKKTTMAVAASAFFSNELFAAKKEAQLTGVQLYSVRDDMKKDPSGTLKQLSNMGYRYVEHANYIDRKFYGYEAKDFRKLLNDLNLKMPSGHTVMGKQHWDDAKKDFTDAWKYTVDDAAVVGQMYVISPWLDQDLRKNLDDLKRFLEIFNKSGELCKKSGMKFGYHNHDFEFSEKYGDVIMHDVIMQNTDPNLVIHQLDIGNLYNGGATALEVVKKWPGRFQSMHVKDEIKATSGDERFESTKLGAGIVPVKEVIDIGKKSAGTIHFIIEQESYQGKTPLASVEEDLKIMKGWGY